MKKVYCYLGVYTAYNIALGKTVVANIELRTKAKVRLKDIKGIRKVIFENCKGNEAVEESSIIIKNLIYLGKEKDEEV